MVWDPAKPAGTDSLKNSDDDLRANFTEIELRRLDNLFTNAGFISRSGGTSAVPDGYSLEGTPTVAYDTVDTGYGNFAVKVTASGATDEGINITLTNLKVSTKYQVFIRTKVTAGDTSSLITTGATTNINEDSTSTSWESITGEFITDASATDVVVKFVASADGDVAYFCGITCVEGDIPPANFIRRVNETIFLTTPLIDTSFDGDAFSDAEADIDLSTFGNGCPPGIKAVFVSGYVKDSASSGAACYMFLGVGGIALSTVIANVHIALEHQGDDKLLAFEGMVVCSAGGDIRYKIDATGTSTFDVYLRVMGYILGE